MLNLLHKSGLFPVVTLLLPVVAILLSVVAVLLLELVVLLSIVFLCSYNNSIFISPVFSSAAICYFTHRSLLFSSILLVTFVVLFVYVYS